MQFVAYVRSRSNSSPTVGDRLWLIVLYRSPVGLRVFVTSLYNALSLTKGLICTRLFVLTCLPLCPCVKLLTTTLGMKRRKKSSSRWQIWRRIKSGSGPKPSLSTESISSKSYTTKWFAKVGRETDRRVDRPTDWQGLWHTIDWQSDRPRSYHSIYLQTYHFMSSASILKGVAINRC